MDALQSRHTRGHLVQADNWPDATPRLIVLIGVCGCGKSSLGAALAQRLHKPFLDGDDFHSAANKEKMARGVPLTDSDRWPWLEALGQALAVEGKRTGMAIAACSALRRSYRDRLLLVTGEPILFVMLDGPKELIASRLAERPGHFMPAGMLDSQLAILERPQPEEHAITLDVSQPLEVMVRRVHDHLFTRR